MTESIDPTEGRVYGGARNLIHIPDGERQEVGKWLATILDTGMRARAIKAGTRTEEQAWGDAERQQPRQQLCPGCYMVAIVALAVELATKNGQPLEQLALSIGGALNDIAANGYEARNMEWIDVLDPPEPEPDPMPEQQQQAQEDGDALVQMARHGILLFPGMPL